jgi:hypothetical protein
MQHGGRPVEALALRLLLGLDDHELHVGGEPFHLQNLAQHLMRWRVVGACREVEQLNLRHHSLLAY